MISSKYSNKPFQSLGQAFPADRSRDRPINGNAPQRRPPPYVAPFSQGGSKRWTNFKRLVDLAGSIETVVSALDMGPGRVRELVEGTAEVDAGLAMHIEEMLGLPGGWLEESIYSSELPVSAKEALGLIPRTEKTQASPIKPVELVLTVTPATNPIVDETTAGKAAIKTQEETSKPPENLIERKAPTMMEAEPKIQLIAQPVVAVKKAGRPSLVSPLTELRRTNFAVLLNGKGFKLICATRMGVKSAFISKMISGLKNIDDGLARDAERAMGRESGWLDADHGFLLALSAPAEITAPPSAATPVPVPMPMPVTKTLVFDAADYLKSKQVVQDLVIAVAAPLEIQQVSRNDELSSNAPADVPRVRVTVADQRPNVSYVERKTIVAQAPSTNNVVTDNAKIGMLAELLIKVVTSKAQSGELSEELAHKMIGQMLNF